MSEPLLTAGQLAAWLNISRAKAYDVEAGRIRIDTAVRWDKAKVQEWLDGQGEAARPQIAFRHLTPSSGSPAPRRRAASRRRAGRNASGA